MERRSRIQRSDQVIFTRNLKTTLSKQKKDARNSKSDAERGIGKRRLGNALTEGAAQSKTSCAPKASAPAVEFARHCKKKEARPRGRSGRGGGCSRAPSGGAGGRGGVGEGGGSAAPTREKLVSGAGGLKAAPPYAVTTGCRLHDWIAPTRRGGLQPAPGKRDPPAGAGPRPPPTQALG